MTTLKPIPLSRQRNRLRDRYEAVDSTGNAPIQLNDKKRKRWRIQEKAAKCEPGPCHQAVGADHGDRTFRPNQEARTVCLYTSKMTVVMFTLKDLREEHSIIGGLRLSH